MEVNHDHPLLHPLIPSSTTITTTVLSDDDDEHARCATPWTSQFSKAPSIIHDISIAPRFMFIFFVAVVSIFANYQASKGFDIIIVNDLKHTPAGTKFNLHFVTNDKCAQMVLRASQVVESNLYPNDSLPRKPVSCVTVALTDYSLARHVAVAQHPLPPSQHYVIQLGTSLMEEADMENEVMLAVLRGMTRVWLWDGEKGAPEEIIEGIVEYISTKSRDISHYRAWRGSDVRSLTSISTDRQVMSVSTEVCWKKWDSTEMVNFMRYCEVIKTGFIERLNQAMRGAWDDQMVENAVGVPIQQICESYHSLKDEEPQAAL